MNLKKEEIRRDALMRRNSLSREEINEKSRIIMEKISCFEEFKNAKTVMLYMEFGSEVSTISLLHDSIALRKKVVLPVTNFDEKNIDLMYFEGIERLMPNRFGILEPPFDSNHEAKREDVELIVVPGIGYDGNGNRVGFGKGYYDKFLHTVKKSIPKIAPAFELQMVESIPTTKDDVRMDKIVTEERVIDLQV